MNAETQVTSSRPALLQRVGQRVWHARAPLLWGLLCIVFYWDVLWASPDMIVGGNDLNHMFRIWLDYARTTLSRSEWPLWNPYLFSGMSFVGDPQPALFYPPTWLALLLPATTALNLILILHVWWSGVGAFGWLRSELGIDDTRLSWWGAFAGAAVFAFSGYTFARVQAGHVGVLTTGAWLPWGLWALRALNKSPSWRGAALGAIVVGMAALAGHTATFIYVGLLLAAYTLYLAWRRNAASRLRFLSLAAAMGVSGLALAAIQVLPLASLLATSTRLNGSDYVFASRFSWPAGYLITLLVPNFFGEPVRTGYWGDGVYEEMIYYVGVLPLLLIAVAWRARRDREQTLWVTFWIVVGGLALLSALGSNGIVHRILYRLLPFFSSMRAPARAGFLFTCSAAALTAYGIRALAGAERRQREELLQPLDKPLVRGILTGAGLVVVVCYLLYAWGKDTNPEIGRFWHVAGEVATFGLFFALASGWLSAWRREAPSRWLPAVAVILLLLDLWTLGGRLVQVVPAPNSAFWRIVATHTDAHLGRVLPWGVNYFEQNGAMAYGVRSVFGYNPLEDEAYMAFVSSVPDPRSRAYDLLNVNHVATVAPLALSENDSLILQAEDNGVYIYERTTAMPRAWIAPTVEQVSRTELPARIDDPGFDPAATTLVESSPGCGGGSGDVSVVHEAANTLQAQVTGTGGLVVFSERFAPGWQAAVDGQAASLLRVDGVLRGVCVPAGTHTVTLRFSPPILWIGAGVSLLAWLGIVIGVIRRPDQPPDDAF